MGDGGSKAVNNGGSTYGHNWHEPRGGGEFYGTKVVIVHGVVRVTYFPRRWLVEILRQPCRCFFLCKKEVEVVDSVTNQSLLAWGGIYQTGTFLNCT